MGVAVFTVPRRLYWDKARIRLVEHGDPAAAFLAFPPGTELSLEEARRFRLLDLVDTPVTAPAPESAVKMAAAPENKLGALDANKSGVVAEPAVVEERARRVTRR